MQLDLFSLLFVWLQSSCMHQSVDILLVPSYNVLCPSQLLPNRPANMEHKQNDVVECTDTRKKLVWWNSSCKDTYKWKGNYRCIFFSKSKNHSWQKFQFNCRLSPRKENSSYNGTKSCILNVVIARNVYVSGKYMLLEIDVHFE